MRRGRKQSRCQMREIVLLEALCHRLRKLILSLCLWSRLATTTSLPAQCTLQQQSSTTRNTTTMRRTCFLANDPAADSLNFLSPSPSSDHCYPFKQAINVAKSCKTVGTESYVCLFFFFLRHRRASRHPHDDDLLIPCFLVHFSSRTRLSLPPSLSRSPFSCVREHSSLSVSPPHSPFFPASCSFQPRCETTIYYEKRICLTALLQRRGRRRRWMLVL